VGSQPKGEATVAGYKHHAFPCFAKIVLNGRSRNFLCVESAVPRGSIAAGLHVRRANGR
jgi:hypothetical protein